MKDRRYANRGQTFEQMLRYTNDRYMSSGVAVICKIPTEILPIRNPTGKIVNAKVVGKSTVDFIGRVGSTPIAAEAKETRSGYIRFDAVEDHQARFLTAYQGQGEAISIVVVSFNLNTFYTVPWPFWKAARDAWKDAQRLRKRTADKITIEHNGQTWTTTGKASVREDELLKEWQVPLGGLFGLDYLQNYRHRELSRNEWNVD